MLDKKEMKILLVDDMDSMRDIIKTMLASLEINNVNDFYDPTKALKELVSGESYDLVICDWFMPEMSGLDFLKEFRNHEKLNNTKFMMIADESEQNDVLMAIKNGADNFLIKPFSTELLKEKLELLF